MAAGWPDRPLDCNSFHIHETEALFTGCISDVFDRFIARTIATFKLRNIG
jgi:hypothetical protein